MEKHSVIRLTTPNQNILTVVHEVLFIAAWLTIYMTMLLLQRWWWGSGDDFLLIIIQTPLRYRYSGGGVQ